MSTVTLGPSGPLKGEIEVPGDKSISHRSVMLGAIAEGETRASHFLMSADCLSTISCFRQLGIEVDVDQEHDSVTVHGKGLHGLSAPKDLLYTGNSGTTTRILSGILAGQSFDSVLDGDASIRKRPMNRVITPLTQMGASVTSSSGNGCTPLHITGGHLHGIDYQSPVASAQVKSCVLLAGLYADGETSVTEPSLSRNHTELMLKGFGANVTSGPAAGSPVSSAASAASAASADTASPARVTADSANLNTPQAGFPLFSGANRLLHCEKKVPWRASVQPEPRLTGQTIIVPGDISSAAYFIAAALIVPGSEVLVKNVGINPTRAGLLKVVQDMGGHVTFVSEYDRGGERAADLLVTSSSLHGTQVGGAIIPTLIDELPVIAVLAAYAEGQTLIKDAAELKVKESDRIAVMTETLTAMGAHVTPTDDGMVIEGGAPLHGAVVDSHKDHRIAMSMAVAALASEGQTSIKDADCVLISYPEFYKDLAGLTR